MLKTMPRSYIDMIIATIFYFVVNLLVKYLDHIPISQIAFFRGLFAFLYCFWFLKRNRIPILGTQKKTLFLRGVFGTIAMVLFFTTLQKMPLASAVTVLYLAPILTTIMTTIILKEHVSLRRWILFAVSMIGVVMVKGLDTRVELKYFAMSIIASFFAAAAYTCISKLKESEHPMVIIFYFPMVAMPFLGPWMAIEWVQPTSKDWILLLLLGVSVHLAQFFMTRSYQTGKASEVALFNYLGLVWAGLSGYFFFDEYITPLAFGGILLVLTSVFLNTLWAKKKNQTT